MTHVPWIWSDSFYVDIKGKSAAALKIQFLQAVNATPGVTVLSSDTHEFDGGGVIVLVSLAESHAALHTWPEHGIGWVGLFTCGDAGSLAAFRAAVSSCVGTIVDLQHSDAVALTVPAAPPSEAPG